MTLAHDDVFSPCKCIVPANIFLYVAILVVRYTKSCAWSDFSSAAVSRFRYKNNRHSAARKIGLISTRWFAPFNKCPFAFVLFFALSSFFFETVTIFYCCICSTASTRKVIYENIGGTMIRLWLYETIIRSWLYGPDQIGELTLIYVYKKWIANTWEGLIPSWLTFLSIMLL